MSEKPGAAPQKEGGPGLCICGEASPSRLVIHRTDGPCYLRPVVAGGAAGEPDPAPPLCVDCGKPVEPARYCYAVPTCYACLPPPPILKVAALRPCLLCGEQWMDGHLCAPAPEGPTVKSEHAFVGCPDAPLPCSGQCHFGPGLCGKPESDPVHTVKSEGSEPAPRVKDYLCLCDEHESCRLCEPAQEPEIPEWVMEAAKAIENADFEGETGAVDYARLIYAAFGSENARKLAEMLFWECPQCCFRFGVEHTDADGSYSCPVCAEQATRKALDEARGLLVATYNCQNPVAAQRIAREIGDFLAAEPPAAPAKQEPGTKE